MCHQWSNEAYVSWIWQDFIDKNMQYSRWHIAPFMAANKTAWIGIAIYIRIKPARHSVVWHSSSPQRDPLWESFTHSKTLIDTGGNAVWHRMQDFKSENTSLLPSPAFLTHLIEQMLNLSWKRGFFLLFILPSNYDEFWDSLRYMIRGRTLTYSCWLKI